MTKKEKAAEMERLLDLVLAEWESDLMSVRCFDLRIVEDIKRVLGRKL